ncbi:unnamed protein product [Ilex paraguariensis]|uniref:Cytochrome P450 n=1 Tax=Ilex paraguariensis TaxID=185542 RepID=A0ABC8UQT1_9AQUA
MYRTHLFGFPSIMACSPAITKFIFRSDDQFPYRWPTNDLVGHNSIISASGQRHDRLRRFLSMAINQPEALRRIATHVQPRIAAALQAWAKKVTFENIGKLFASIEPGPLLDSLGYNFEGMVKGMRAQPFNIPGTAYHHALKV